MKKVLSLLFSGVITFSLCACGQGNSSGSPTDEDLNNAAGNLYLAEVAIDSAASLLLENWTTTGSVMNCYFDESAYEELNSGSLKASMISAATPKMLWTMPKHCLAQKAPATFMMQQKTTI